MKRRDQTAAKGRMSGRVLFLAMLLAVAAVAVVAVVLLHGGDRRHLGRPAVALGTDLGASPRKPDDLRDALALEEAVESEGDEAAREALLPVGLFVSGQVIDAVTREPVAPYHVRLLRRAEEGHNTTKRHVIIAEDVIRSADGSFHLEVDREATCLLMVSSSRYPMKTLDDLRVCADTGHPEVLIELEPGLRISGCVLDDDSGRPVAGAIVASSRHASGILRELDADDFEERYMHATTGADGLFTLYGLEKGRHRIGAFHPDYAEGCATCRTGDGAGVEIRLRPGFCISGRVLADCGRPCGGALVQVVGEGTPLVFYTSTDSDGRYRTAAVLPGEVEVSAGPPWGASEEDVGLSREWKVVLVEDGDVEVDFGPLSEHIEWRGVFYGYDGAPQPGGAISLSRSAGFGEGNRHLGDDRRGSCDKDGRFVFRRLLPGAYDVWLKLSDGTPLRRWKTIVLDTPGLMEQDVCLHRAGGAACGEISGCIVDGLTGGPPQADYMSVRALVQNQADRSYQGQVDDDGRFSIKGLPPDTYKLDVSATGYWCASVRDIQLAEGQFIGGVRAELSRDGTLHVRLAGFHDPARRAFQIIMCNLETGRPWVQTGNTSEDGSAESDLSAAPGEWLVGVAVRDAGVAQITCAIASGQTTRLELGPSDFLSSNAAVSVQGRLTNADGSGIAHANLEFTFATPLWTRERTTVPKEAVTKPDGRFRVEGLQRGCWSVSLTTPAGCETKISDFSIPQGAADPVEIDMTLPGGTVSGAIVDVSSGAALQPNGPAWRLTVYDAASDTPVVTSAGDSGASDFKIVGVPAGTFYVGVLARGFKSYESAPFEHPGKGDVDLGAIVLERCGVLILKVVDETGLPVKGFDALFDGGRSWASMSEGLPPGQSMYYSLPLGEVSVEVGARGFQNSARRVTLTPDGPRTLLIELKRK